MSKLNYTEAFATFGAKLVNPRWAYSAIAEDGSVVLSCWHEFLKPARGSILRYEDSFARWSTNAPGKNLLRKHLYQAIEGKLPVRLIVARPKNAATILGGRDASKVTKTFDVREDLVGEVVKLPTEKFVIDFRHLADLDERADEQRWDESFARSPDVLARLAAKAREDIQAGRVRRGGVDQL